MNPGENEGVVRYALDKYPFLKLAPQVTDKCDPAARLDSCNVGIAPG